MYWRSLMVDYGYIYPPNLVKQTSYNIGEGM